MWIQKVDQNEIHGRWQRPLENPRRAWVGVQMKKDRW